VKVPFDGFRESSSSLLAASFFSENLARQLWTSYIQVDLPNFDNSRGSMKLNVNSSPNPTLRTRFVGSVEVSPFVSPSPSPVRVGFRLDFRLGVDRVVGSMSLTEDAFDALDDDMMKC
jgi:hypothetical protein